MKFIPLPRHGYDAAIERVINRKLGTRFGGKAAIGINIDDLVKREAKMSAQDDRFSEKSSS